MSGLTFDKEKEMGTEEFYPEFPLPYGTAPAKIPKFHTPITPRENFERIMRNEKPLWVPNYYVDFNFIQPLVMKDAAARWTGGKDWFGIEWQYEPLTNASMVKPGTRRLSDITKWEEELEFPDLTKVDWEKDFKENYEGKLDKDRPTMFVIVNGLFERTADLTSFEDAFCYLIEEPEALEAFYTRLTDWLIQLITIVHQVYGVDVITLHDDMGTQRSPFFSTQMFREIMCPHYQRITNAAHELGMYVNFHSCGCIEAHLEAIIEAGFDCWEGQDNSNDKKRTMELCGDRLVQSSNFVPEPDMPIEEARKVLKDWVETLGKKGRFMIWLNTTQEPYLTEGSRTIYETSRKLYENE